MTDAIVTDEVHAGVLCRRRRSPGLIAPAVTAASALTASVLVGGWLLAAQPSVLPDLAEGPLPTVAALGHAVAAIDRALLDPAVLGVASTPLGRGVLLQSAFEAPAPTPVTPPATVAIVAPPAMAAPAILAAAAAPVTVVAAAPDVAPEPTIVLPVAPASPLVAAVPLPTQPGDGASADRVPLPAPRPPELRAQPIAVPPVRSASRATRPARSVVALAPPADNRSFFEKVFGGFGQPAPGPALAYAAPDDGAFHDVQRSAPRAVMPTPVPSDQATAVYDISAHTVTLPNGTRLEAHSGIGARLDDPRHVADRNLGPTPPHVYDLTPREQLFHGVPALRLTPVGGGGVYGRTGLLAHSFMLGPNGDSNGCVSFRDYKAFLEAFRRGEVRRLVVIARAG